MHTNAVLPVVWFGELGVILVVELAGLRSRYDDRRPVQYLPRHTGLRKSRTQMPVDIDGAHSTYPVGSGDGKRGPLPVHPEFPW